MAIIGIALIYRNGFVDKSVQRFTVHDKISSHSA